jgi:hypothetical protein
MDLGVLASQPSISARPDRRQPDGDEPSPASEPAVPSEPELDDPEPGGPPPPLGPRRAVALSLELLRRAAPDIRRGALGVGLQFLGVVGPILVLLAVAMARLPDPAVLFETSPPPTAADAELASLAGLGLLIALAGGTALAIESRAIGLALIGAGAAGRPLSLRAALRRSRQAFWRLVLLTVGVELPLGVAATMIADGIVGAGAAGTPLATTVGFGVTLALQVPIAYAAGGVVVADLGLRSALGASLRLVMGRPRLAAVVVAVGGIAQILLVLALSGGLEVVGLVADLADLRLDGDAPRTFLTLAVLLGVSSAVGSLLFSVTCLAVAPQAAVVALAGGTAGLDRAAAAEGVGATRWLSVPMALGIAAAVVISVVGIQNVVARG